MPELRGTPGESAWDSSFTARGPWFAPLAPAAELLRGWDDWPDVAALDSLLGAPGARPAGTSGIPFRLVEQEGAGDGPPYEEAIFQTGGIPTRPRNWHDLFNALVWATFPASKAALNARHAEARRGRPSGANRGPVEDALTGFDESGVVVACADPQLADLLLGFQWMELFWLRRRAVIEGMGFVVFGHGLYERALRPFVGLTGKGIVIPVADSFLRSSRQSQLAELDLKLAAFIRDPARLASPRELAPVPVLGVPGWWPPNEGPEFYGNAGYFRPGRRP